MSWSSPVDGKILFTQNWPADECKATLVLIHGIFEHSGRYDEYAKTLASRGIEVRSFDLRGHGQSDGTKGYFERFQFLIDDAVVFVEEVINDSPFPVFILGHSLGGLIACHLALRIQEKITGLVLSSPAVRLALKIPPFMLRLSDKLSELVPKFGLLPGNPSLISSDAEEVERYKSDPHNFRGRAPTRVGAETIAAMKSLQPRLSEIEIPFLVYHSKSDMITDYRGSEMLYMQASSKDKAIKLFEGTRHESHYESIRFEVFDLVSQWILDRSASTA